MLPNLSLFVTKEKYRDKKTQVIQLTNKNQELIQELAESNRQFREAEKELSQLLDIFSVFDITKEEGERLLRKAKNYAQKIQILEGRVKGILWLVNHLNQQNQTKDNEINELYVNEIGGEIEKTLRDKNLAWLKTSNQNWQVSYHIAQVKLNQANEREEELLQTTHEKLIFLTSQLTNLTLSLNYIKWERDNWQAKFSQLENEKDKLSQNIQTQVNQTNQIQQELGQQRQKNDDLQNELAEEKRNNYRSQRNRRNPRWRDSEATLFGIEEEEQGETSDKVKNLPRTQTNPNWKSTLLNKTKKLGLTFLAAYGSYQTGYHQGASSNNQLQANCQTLTTPSIYPVFANSTHSWQENPFFPTTHCDLDSPNQFLTFQNSDFTLPPLHDSNHLLNELEQLKLRPNITQAEYERLKANQAPTNLPLDWEKQLAYLKDLETKLAETQKRPTQKQLDQAVQVEKSKHQHLVDPQTYKKDWINPAELITEAEKKGMASLETYNQRPNITLPEYNNLLNSQKPLDLPANWKSELASIPKLEDKIKKQKERINELKSRPKQTELDQKERINELKSRPKQTELDQKVNETIAKYKDFINPTNTAKIIDIAKAKGYQFQQADIDNAIKTNNQTWIDKGLINPHNETDLISVGLVKKTDLDNKAKTCNTLNQIKIDLELKLLTKSAKIEQLNSLLNTLKAKYSQVRNDKDKAVRTQKLIEKERDNALTERDTAFLGLENLNQQLDDAQQKLVRNQRKNRKLTQKLNQQQTHQTKTQQQHKEQSSYLTNILQCLASAGIGAKLAWKAGRIYEKGELQTKYFKDIQNGINTLIEQKREVQQNQQRAEVERDQLQSQIANHRCAVNSLGYSSCPSQEINQTNSAPIQNQTKTIHQNNTQQIIQELNTALYLNLKNPTLNQVIIEIQSRLAKDPLITQKGFNYVFDSFQTVEKELIQQTTPFGEDLEVIKDLEIKGLNELLPNQLEESFIREIKQAQNYQQLVQVRNSFLSKHLAKVQQTEIKEVVKEMSQIKPPIKQNNQERYIWISLLVVSLVSIGGLLWKLKETKRAK
jgi:hypothetical protein